MQLSWTEASTREKAEARCPVGSERGPKPAVEMRRVFRG